MRVNVTVTNKEVQLQNAEGSLHHTIRSGSNDLNVKSYNQFVGVILYWLGYAVKVETSDHTTRYVNINSLAKKIFESAHNNKFRLAAEIHKERVVQSLKNRIVEITKNEGDISKEKLNLIYDDSITSILDMNYLYSLILKQSIKNL